MAGAVREQLKVEVYVPLRAAVSRWCVTGRAEEDAVMRVKMETLRAKPLEFFGVPGREFVKGRLDVVQTLISVS